MTSDEIRDSVIQQIPGELAGRRLDQALARMFPEFSRSRLKDWIVAGLVSVDGKAPRPRDPVRGGELVRITPRTETAVTSAPEAIELVVAYEDEDLLVIDKPTGLVVHPGAGNIRGTLMNGLLYRVPALAELPRAGIIHRLDKDTSGLLLVAKSPAMHTELVRKLAAREISRHYLAICTGTLTGGGTIEAPIGRHPVDRRRMGVQERGKRAVTRYRVVRRFAAHTAVDVELETGRTHQIRVHFAHRRHPLVGDPLYGGRLAVPAGAGEELAAALRAFRRQALHACRLGFAHPRHGTPLDVESAPPADLRDLLEVLARDQESRA